MSFHGIIPPVVTLFDEAGNLDLELNRRYLDKLISQNIHGILLMGSSGEFSSLSIEERKLYVREMIKHIHGRVKVMVGVGHTALKEVLELTSYAEELGADGVLVVSPYYWKLSDDQLYRFYSTVASRTELPVFIYNIPQLTGQNLPVELIIKLAKDYQNISGIKETVGDFGHIRQVMTEVKKVRPDFLVFSAFDEHMLPALMIGAAGSINGSAVFAPEVSVDLYESYQRGDLAKAQSSHLQISSLMDVYTYCPTFFTSMKEAVHQRWFDTAAGHRAPFDVYPANLRENVRNLLKIIETKEGVQL
ncbi:MULTISPECIES: dihydrodipicolinate synthase family protein [unclassified Cytobacillus]|uniref:dihydrodipicolinate synthase family protein n=1 Tax=unclassified Cytobacillus TaxID=2675268 RepID=UPI001357FCC8|nr:dihydrodipicolinate synthase family protein [Cytobacillus sp. AMY 15.2]KAF0818948.1 putative lyase YjhH [Bacillus sp. ZZV12-4809]MCM3092489.1 dihydrodipicolinate synthase family protein [Cytobacillus sp. AMY 15.2]